jgi:hypothetical protein
VALDPCNADNNVARRITDEDCTEIIAKNKEAHDGFEQHRAKTLANPLTSIIRNAMAQRGFLLEANIVLRGAAKKPSFACGRQSVRISPSEKPSGQDRSRIGA